MSKPNVLGIRIRRHGIVMCIIALFASCYEPIDGCLDLQATNFSFSADNACSQDECCEYPSVEYSFSPLYGDSILQSSAIFENEIGQLFSISSYDFMISNTRLFQADGEEVITRDTFDVFTGIDSDLTLTTLDRDIQQITNRNLNVTIPNIREVGEFSGFSFSVGVTSQVQLVNAISYTDTDNPIQAYEDQFTNEGFNWLNWTILVYQQELDTLVVSDTLSIQMNQNHLPVSFTADTLFTKNNGIDIPFDIEMDFREWIDGVDFGMSEAEIADICRSNIEKTFSLQ